MPPRSYVITAVVLAALVAISFPLTLGFSIILWYWLFAAAACILAVAGAFKIASGLGAPPWIGLALASPGLVWAANKVFELISNGIHPVIWTSFDMAARLALLAAAAGALRLVEMMSRPPAVFRVGYALLAASAVLLGVGWTTYDMGWIYPKPALYAISAVGIAALLVGYGAFIGAAVLITMRRDIERWTGAAISLVTAYVLYKAITPMFLVEIPGYRGDGPLFWLEPVVMFVGGAAVWRIGSVLRAQAHSERPVQSLAIGNARPSAPNAGL
jgi:hypothetical protein